MFCPCVCGRLQRNLSIWIMWPVSPCMSYLNLTYPTNCRWKKERKSLRLQIFLSSPSPLHSPSSHVGVGWLLNRSFPSPLPTFDMCTPPRWQSNHSWLVLISELIFSHLCIALWHAICVSHFSIFPPTTAFHKLFHHTIIFMTNFQREKPKESKVHHFLFCF